MSAPTLPKITFAIPLVTDGEHALGTVTAQVESFPLSDALLGSDAMLGVVATFTYCDTIYECGSFLRPRELRDAPPTGFTLTHSPIVVTPELQAVTVDGRVRVQSVYAAAASAAMQATLGIVKADLGLDAGYDRFDGTHRFADRKKAVDLFLENSRALVEAILDEARAMVVAARYSIPKE